MKRYGLKRKRAARGRRRFRKRRINRRIAKANTTNTRKYHFKFRCSYPISGVSYRYIATMMNYPFWIWDGNSNTYAELTSYLPPAYSRCQNLFSEYVVKGLGVKFIPRYNIAQVDTTVGVADSYMIVDPRVPNFANDSQEAANYPSMTQWMTYRGMSKFVKNTFTRGWFKTFVAPNTALVVGTQTPPNPLGALGFSIKCPNTQDPETTSGFLVLTYYVTFRGIQTGQVLDTSSIEANPALLAAQGVQGAKPLAAGGLLDSVLPFIDEDAEDDEVPADEEEKKQ